MMQFCFLTVVIKDFTKNKRPREKHTPTPSSGERVKSLARGSITRNSRSPASKPSSTGKLRTSFCVAANGCLSRGHAGWEGTNSSFCFAVHDKEPHDAAGQPRAGRRGRDPAAPLLQGAGLGPAQPAADGAPLQTPHCTWGGGLGEGHHSGFFWL